MRKEMAATTPSESSNSGRRQADKEDGGQGNMVDIYIAKQRNGPTGMCSLFDRKGVFRFENAAYGPR